MSGSTLRFYITPGSLTELTLIQWPDDDAGAVYLPGRGIFTVGTADGWSFWDEVDGTKRAYDMHDPDMIRQDKLRHVNKGEPGCTALVTFHMTCMLGQPKLAFLRQAIEEIIERGKGPST